MERNEAKAILELCRPGNSDDLQDPMITEALALLESDAELRAWFEEQQAVDGRICEAYKAVDVPSDLKTNILAGMRAHALRGESEKAKILPRAHDKMDDPTTSQTWWRNPWIGVAAVFALLFAIVAIPGNNSPTQPASPGAQTLQAGVPDMIQFLANEIDTVKRESRSFDKRSDQTETLQAYLASTGTPSPAYLPSPVSGKPSLGCFTLDYNGIKMGMICFKEDQLIHLITARKTDCMGQIQETPSIYEIGDQAFKVWVEGDQVYIISVHGSKEKLPKFI